MGVVGEGGGAPFRKVHLAKDEFQFNISKPIDERPAGHASKFVASACHSGTGSKHSTVIS